jgi:hypothetical protein
MVQIHYWFQDKFRNRFKSSSGRYFESVSRTGFRAVSEAVSDTDSTTGFEPDFRTGFNSVTLSAGFSWFRWME